MPCCKRCAAHVAGQQRNGPACAPIEAAAGRFRVFHSSEKNSRARAICLCTQSRVRSPRPPFVYISVQASQPVHRTSLLLMSCLRPMRQWCGALDACKCCNLCHDVATVLQALSAAACARWAPFSSACNDRATFAACNTTQAAARHAPHECQRAALQQQVSRICMSEGARLLLWRGGCAQARRPHQSRCAFCLHHSTCRRNARLWCNASEQLSCHIPCGIR